MCFRGVMNRQRMFTGDLGIYTAARSNWLNKHGWTGEKVIHLHLPPRTGLAGGKDRAGARWDRIRGARVALVPRGWGYPSTSASGGVGGPSPVAAEYMPPPPPRKLRLHLGVRPALAVRVHQGQEEDGHPPFNLRPAAILEYFTRELPQPGGPGPSVGAKRARVQTLAVGHAVTSRAGVGRTTQCHKRNITAQAGGLGRGKELAIMVE